MRAKLPRRFHGRATAPAAHDPGETPASQASDRTAVDLAAIPLPDLLGEARRRGWQPCPVGWHEHMQAEHAREVARLKALLGEVALREDDAKGRLHQAVELGVGAVGAAARAEGEASQLAEVLIAPTIAGFEADFGTP